MRDAAVPVLELARFDASEVAEMISACADVTGAAAATVAELAEGLPLAIEDIVASGGRGQLLRFADNVRSRFTRLDERTRSVLEVAALLGERPNWSVAARAAGEDDEHALRAAIAADFVEVDDDGDVEFRHALTRRWVIDGMTSPVRGRRAQAAVRILDQEASVSLAQALLRAELWEIAGDRTQALDCVSTIGTTALEAGDLVTATVALERALVLSDDAVASRTLSIDLVTAHRKRGNLDGAARLASATLAEVEGVDSAAATAMHIELARVAIAGGAYDTARDSIMAARRARPDSTEVGAVVALLHANCALGDDRPGQRAVVEHQIESAVALAREATDGRIECEALELAGRVRRMRDLDAAIESFDAALRVAEREGLAYERLVVLNELGTAEMLRDATTARLERARGQCGRVGAFGVAASAGINLASGCVMTGRHAEGIAIGTQVAELAARLGIRPIEAAAELMIGIGYAFGADERNANAHLARAEALAPDDPDLAVGVWGIGRGVGALVRERRDEARAAFERSSEVAPERHARILDAARGPSMLLAANAREIAPGSVEATWRREPRGARWSDLWFGAALAVASAHDGDACAEARLTAALTAGERFPLFGALVRRIVAETAATTGFADPIALLRDAEAEFARLGLRPGGDACRSLLLALGAAAPRRRSSGVVAPELRQAGITPREADVLALLGDRLTNREIAERLFVSAKTVEKHVAALAQKLGLADRRSIGDWERRRAPHAGG